MYVALCMPVVPVWGFWSDFCGLHCPNVILFLACGGTWRCERTLFCDKIVERLLSIFIHSTHLCDSFQSSGLVYFRMQNNAPTPACCDDTRLSDFKQAVCLSE